MNATRTARFLTPAFLMLLSISAVIAQNVTTGAELAHYSPAAKPFWKLHTDYAANHTVVRFFSSDSQMVYEEQLPARYIKMTRKNMRQLDEVLARRTSSQLVAASVQLTDLEEVPPRAKRGTGFQINTFASGNGVCLNLCVENPYRETLKVRLSSRTGEVLYETFSDSDKRLFKFNMAGMPEGQYKLSVSSRNQRFDNLLAIEFPENKRTIAIIPANRVQVARSGN